MKCEIIRDLLPIYIEGLCSAKTKEAVEAHLEICQECRQEYLQLKQDYQAGPSDEEKIETYLEEKDLMEKSKEAIKMSMIDQLIGKFFFVIAVLGFFINILMAVLTFVFYQYRFPGFYFKELGRSQILILLLPFFPTVLALTGKRVMKKIKNLKIRKITLRLLFAGTIPAILMGGICTVFFLAVPPLGSVTDNPSHYMELDGDMEPFKSVAAEFLPGQIPEQAGQVDYHYERYASFFSGRCSVEASWTLPEEEYTKVKDEMIQNPYFRDSALSESGGNGTFLTTVYPERVTISFEYRDKEKKVVYRADCSENY